MNEDVLRKAENNEPLTAEEVEIYQAMVKPKKQVYGKYGNLALRYLQEYNVAKYWSLGGDVPEYLHGVDKVADKLYMTMYEKLSSSALYKKNGDFLHDLQVETEIKRLIEEEILNEVVYVN